MSGDAETARAVLAAADDGGVDLHAITRELEREGVEAFCDSYQQLLSRIEARVGSLVGTP